jgi:shikimate O-hydroxycinnamoyltransferase
MFECGGLAIGVGVPHRILDAFSAFAFINAFAGACRIGIDKVEYCPNFQQGSIFPARDMTNPINIPPQEILKANHKALVKRFVFDGAATSKLKAAVVNASLGGSELLKRQPTRVEVVVALTWNTLMKVAEARNGHLRPSISRFAVNLRGIEDNTTDT